MDPEQISLIVLICMTALLLFQKKIFLFSKGVYERSKNILIAIWMILFFVIALIPILFVDLPISDMQAKFPVISFTIPETRTNFIAVSLFLFSFIFLYKIPVFLKTYQRSFLFGGVFFFFILTPIRFYDSMLPYLLHKNPTIIDMGIGGAVFINWLDLVKDILRGIGEAWGTCEKSEGVKEKRPMKKRTKVIIGISSILVTYILFLAIFADAALIFVLIFIVIPLLILLNSLRYIDSKKWYINPYWAWPFTFSEETMKDFAWIYIIFSGIFLIIVSFMIIGVTFEEFGPIVGTIFLVLFIVSIVILLLSPEEEESQ